jgi:hypothetical protein
MGRVLLSGMVAGALGAGAVPALAGGRPQDCRTRGRTVEANGSVRVFVTVRAEGHVRTYYGCDLARRRARELGVWEGGGEGGVTGRFGLAGRRVAFEDVVCGDYTNPCNGNVFRIDMRTGHLRVVASYPGPPWMVASTDLLLTPNDTVVWIRPNGQREDAAPAVSKVGPDDKLVVLDDAPGVDPGSLAATGNRVYWTRAGTPQTKNLRRTRDGSIRDNHAR